MSWNFWWGWCEFFVTEAKFAVCWVFWTYGLLFWFPFPRVQLPALIAHVVAHVIHVILFLNSDWLLVFTLIYIHKVITIIAPHFRTIVHADLTAVWLADVIHGNQTSLVLLLLQSVFAGKILINSNIWDHEGNRVGAQLFYGRFWMKSDCTTKQEFHTVSEFYSVVLICAWRRWHHEKYTEI